MSNLDGAMPVIRRSMGPMHSLEHNRSVSQKELLTSMGFIVYKDLEQKGQAILMPKKMLESTPAMRNAVGNAMHLPNCNTVLAVAMAAVRRATEAEIVYNKRRLAETAAHIRIGEIITVVNEKMRR